jgi:hypothetical protein
MILDLHGFGFIRQVIFPVQGDYFTFRIFAERSADIKRSSIMNAKNLTFGSIDIDGRTYLKDLVIDNGLVKKREKSESKKYRDRFGHTPLSAEENIPWNCKRLIIGAGHSSSLPVMDEIYDIAATKGVELVIMSTPEALKHINDPLTNLILHLTC